MIPGNGPSPSGGDVKIPGHPEVRTALEHHILDAITVSLEAIAHHGIERRALGIAADHLLELLADECVARFESFSRLHLCALPVPMSIEFLKASAQVREQHLGMLFRVGGVTGQVG